MSDLRVSSIKTRTGDSPRLPDGVVVTGVTTTTTFKGNLSGNVTGNVAGIATGNVTGNISGTTGSFSGNVSVGGTITYEDVTSIDSVGVITAKAGIKVGAGQSISAVSGIVTYYGDGSQLSGVKSGVVNFVASGTIANGKTVVINTDGTVGIVTVTATNTPTAGDAVTFDSDNSTYSDVGYDPDNGKVVVAYADGGNSEKGTAIVGTVSGSSISFGTPVVFESGGTAYPSVAYDTTNNKIVIAYQDDSDSDRSKAIVGTVSDTSISFGSAALVDSDITNQTNQVAAYDSANNRVVVAYSDVTNSKGKVAVGTVSGTEITFGTPVEFFSAETQFIALTYDSTNEKVVIAWRQAGSSPYAGKAVVGTVSGTSISFGTIADFEAGATTQIGATYDSTNGKVVIAYKDDDDNDYGKAVVGTVSGTDITFGTPVTFESADTYRCHAAYDTANNKVVIGYSDNGNSLRGTVITGTVSGTSITFGTAVVFNNNGNTDYIGVTYDSSNDRAVIVYRDRGDSNKGKSVVLSNGTTNLTSENYIGIAEESIADGATGKINVVGGISDGQTGLTTGKTYYVQNNGTLSTSAGSPSVVAGNSISSTKIIVS